MNPPSNSTPTPLRCQHRRESNKPAAKPGAHLSLRNTR